MKKVLILGVLVLLLGSCAGVQIQTPDEFNALRIVGKGTAFSVLRNNPGHIPDAERLTKAAIERATNPQVDVMGLLYEMQLTCGDLQVKMPGDARLIAAILSEVKIIVENDQARVPKVLALLNGVKEGIELAKQLKGGA
jgi:hypothetical protein